MFRLRTKSTMALTQNSHQSADLKRCAKTGIAALLICVVIVSTGCLRAYRPNIQQGNIVTTEMLESLEQGMSRREVRYVLGSPMIEDPFHADRWDYVYTLREGRSKKRKQSTITVVFDNDRLASVEGDPALREISELDSGNSVVGKSSATARRFWDRLFKRRNETSSTN